MPPLLGGIAPSCPPAPTPLGRGGWPYYTCTSHLIWQHLDYVVIFGQLFLFCLVSRNEKEETKKA